MPVSSSTPSPHAQISPESKPTNSVNLPEGSSGAFQIVFQENAASHTSPGSSRRDSTREAGAAAKATVPDAKASNSSAKSHKSAPPTAEVPIALVAQVISLATPSSPLLERVTPKLGLTSTQAADSSSVVGERSFAGMPAVSSLKSPPSRDILPSPVIKEPALPLPDGAPFEATFTGPDQATPAESSTKVTPTPLVANSFPGARLAFGVAPAAVDHLEIPKGVSDAGAVGQTQSTHDASLVAIHGEEAAITQGMPTRGSEGEGTAGNLSLANPYLATLAAQPPVTGIIHGSGQAIEVAQGGGGANIIHEPQEMVQIIGAHLSSNPNLPSLLHLKVTPEGMGTLDIHIEATTSGLHIKLETTSFALGNSLANSLTDLKEQMRSALGTNVNLEMGLGGSFNQSRTAENFSRSFMPASPLSSTVTGSIDLAPSTADKGSSRLVDVLA